MKYVVEIIIDLSEKESNKSDAKRIIETLGFEVLNVRKFKNTRTLKQNKALHKMFQETADLLNEKGFDMRAIYREEVPIMWTAYSVKDMWKKIQQAMFGTNSTTKLDRHEQINKVFDTFNNLLIERTKGEVSLTFPSKEAQLNN